MKPLETVNVAVGKTDVVPFPGGGRNGTTAHVTWPGPAPVTPAEVRLIVTPNNDRQPAAATTGHTAAPVVVVDNLTSSGFKMDFTITAFNADGVNGEAGFDFLAVQEAGERRRRPPDLRFGIGQPKVLAQGGTPGDWGGYFTTFGSGFAAGPPFVRLLTAHNMGETGLTARVVDQQKVRDEALRGGDCRSAELHGCGRRGRVRRVHIAARRDGVHGPQR